MLVPLNIPPGVVKPGTVYDAKGRWYDADLVRWRDGVMQPIGGWSLLTGAGDLQIDGITRKIFPWKLNNGDAQVAIGTNTDLYVYYAGALSTITPGGIVTGAADASGTYWSRNEADSWSIDNYGEDLVACLTSDGKIYYYDDSAGSIAQLANSPTGCVGTLVTPENFVVALGSDGNPRQLAWADPSDPTIWTADTTNQAGSQVLQTPGDILAGRAARAETLVWTTADLWVLRYIGGNFIYRFEKVGQGGAISRNSMTIVDNRAFWMGEENFYLYDGYINTIPCSVSDYVFNDLNRAQKSKISATVRADFHEVWWFYPSSGATENDRYVVYNWNMNIWYTGNLPRTCGADRVFLEYPMAAGPNGEIYFHEAGTSYTDEDATSYTPSAESGPYEIADGDRTMMVRQVVPDEDTLGDVDIYVIHSFYPTASETTEGPLTAREPTDVRVSARQVRLRLVQDQANWRFGTCRLDVVPGSRR